MSRLSDLNDEQLRGALVEHGSIAAVGRATGVAESTARDEFRRRGIAAPLAPSRAVSANAPRRPLPALTRESLHRALEPPNNCKVKTYLDRLDDGTRAVVEEALGYQNADFSSSALRRWLIAEGHPEAIVPGEDAIKDHRAGRKPCRCR